LSRVSGKAQAESDLEAVQESLVAEANQEKGTLKELFLPTMRLVLTIGIVIEILQQITGINSVFFYAPMIFIGILGFVAGFGISLGPVMWVLFSELFPNRIRGIAISFCGLINSSVSFVVQLVFPWELENFGPSMTFLIYGSFAIIGLIFVTRILPETKGKSLEELQVELVSKK